MQNRIEKLVDNKKYYEGILEVYDGDGTANKPFDEVREGLRFRIEQVNKELEPIVEEIHEGFERAISELVERKMNVCFFAQKNKEKRLCAINKRIEALRQYTLEFIREIPLGAWNTLDRLNDK